MKELFFYFLMPIKPNPVREQSFLFALNIVRFCKKLDDKREFVLSRQLLKSGTSIGANIAEAMQGQSKPDFISKLSISLKEAHETDYWLRIIQATDVSLSNDCHTFRTDLDNIISLLTAIIKTSKQNLHY